MKRKTILKSLTLAVGMMVLIVELLFNAHAQNVKLGVTDKLTTISGSFFVSCLLLPLVLGYRFHFIANANTRFPIVLHDHEKSKSEMTKIGKLEYRNDGTLSDAQDIPQHSIIPVVDGARISCCASTEIICMPSSWVVLTTAL